VVLNLFVALQECVAAELNWTRVYAIASSELDDLLVFCDALAART
jgi:hypothetical protein